MRTNFVSKLKVGVAGGSIAGCAIAALLSRNGAIEVKVFERSKDLSERGAGIVLPNQLLAQCFELKLFKQKETPHIPASKRQFWIRGKSKELICIFEQPINLIALNWSSIYNNLRSAVPGDCYEASQEVTSIVNTEHGVTITNASNKENFDLLIAADGVNSFIRDSLFKTTISEYAGYVAWRGTISIHELALEEKFKTQFHYFLPPDGIKGHLLIYPIPAPDYKETGNILINWMFYEAVSAEELKLLMIDKTGKPQKISIPKHYLREDHITNLRSLANKYFPPQIAQIISKTTTPFLQVIFDSRTPEFVKSRVCFIGDSGMTLRPHTGSGVGHALTFAFDLAENLKNIDSLSLEKILENWNQGRFKYAEQQLELSKNLGDALVMRPPCWSKLGCDIFLMASPKFHEYKTSDIHNLYLYKNAENKIFYYIGDQIFNLECSSIPFLKEAKFDQPKDNPTKCEDIEICKAVIAITSKLGHTAHSAHKWWEDVIKGRPWYVTDSVKEDKKASSKRLLFSKPKMPQDALPREPQKIRSRL